MSEVAVFDHGYGPVAVPRCPRCGSSGSSCVTCQTKAAAPAWHLAREDAVARVCGCSRCREWLFKRAQPPLFKE